jgi:uncharacterized protein (TIGR02145 family)
MKMNQLNTVTAAVLTAMVFLFSGCGKDDDTNKPKDKVPETGTITDINGNLYKTVKIGGQWWMAENLRATHYSDGAPITEVTDDWAWSSMTTDGMCWYDNDFDKYGSVYGGLYNWYAVDKGKLCPAGWHVPTDQEWQILEKQLGMSQEQADGLGWRGTDEGGKLKETGTDHWISPNTGATNTTWFSALPGGYRNHFNGYFGFVTGVGYFWTASFPSSHFAWYRELGYHETKIQRSYFDYKYGFSVRCVKD